MKLLLMGPPGVGKGTQAERIREELNIVHLSTGEILREEVKLQTNIGKEAIQYMDKGKLVSDQILIEIVKKEFQKKIVIMVIYWMDFREHYPRQKG